MAELIIAKEAVYEKLDQLKTIHDAILREIRAEIKDTKQLVGKNNGFQIEETSKKVKDLLETYEKEVLPSLEDVFKLSEKSAQAMGKMLIEEDKAKL